jgi:excisionase family DNA binding protein
MRYYNAVEAAKELNISDKTIRRWVKKGKISAKRTQFNEIAIPQSEIDRLRLELGSPDQWVDSLDSIDRGVSLRSTAKLDRVDTSDIEERMASLAQSIANLNATVDIQSRRINELTKRVTDLETRLNAAQDVTRQSTPSMSMDETTKTESPLSTTTGPNIPIPSNLPPGTLHSSEFADQLGIKRTVFDSMMKNGIAGEELERTKIPIVARPGTNKNYFTPLEQQKALDLLRKHGKLPEV